LPRDRANKPAFAKDPVVDRSLRHSIKDGVLFSVMVGGPRAISPRSPFFCGPARRRSVCWRPWDS